MKTYKLLFFALIFVLLLGRVFADDSLYQYIERDKDKIKDFEQIEGKDRNELWKNAEDLNKAIAVKKLAQYINQRLRRGDSAFGMISEGMDIAKKLLPEKFFKELGDAKIDIVTDYNKAKETAKKYGVDLDGYVRAELESVRGFEAGDLKWSEKQGNKNTIGNGKVWLNLEKLPVQTTSVEYTDGKFVLGMKD